MENVLKNRILSFLQKNNLLDTHQYGFLRNSGTQGAVVDFLDLITNLIDKKQYVITVFVDLSKAFDTVDHALLLRKLQCLGIRGSMLDIIKSYVLDRKQYTHLNEINSNVKNVQTGVPQGSVLGPLLYLIYVLSLNKAGLKATYFTYADDTILVYHSENLANLEAAVNTDLRKYYLWLLNNKLKINCDKTVFMLFKQKNKAVFDLNIKIGSKILSRVSNCKYLGVQIDDLLSWSIQYEHLCKKIMPMIGAIYKTRCYLTKELKYKIYHAFFGSKFTYLITAWASCTNTLFNKFQKLQNKVVKILFSINYLAPTVDVYNMLKIYSLKSLVKIEQSKLIYKIIKNKQKSNVIIKKNCSLHKHQTRGAQCFYLHPVFSNIGLNNPIALSLQTFNNLPEYLRNMDKERRFVKNLKEHFSFI